MGLWGTAIHATDHLLTMLICVAISQCCLNEFSYVWIGTKIISVEEWRVYLIICEFSEWTKFKDCT